MLVGSPFDPVVYTLITLLDPAVINRCPFFVYIKEVGPGGSIKRISKAHSTEP